MVGCSSNVKGEWSCPLPDGMHGCASLSEVDREAIQKIENSKIITKMQVRKIWIAPRRGVDGLLHNSRLIYMEKQ